MRERSPSLFVRFFSGLWWLLDGTRRLVLNLLFLALLVLVLWAVLKSGQPPLQAKTALVISLDGPVVEQRASNPRQSLLGQLQGDDRRQTLLREVLDTLDAAARDDNISHAVLVLDNFEGAGLSGLREMAAALERFKAAGKPVTAWGSQFDQRQYYLAAHASEVWMHPMGVVLIEGLGRHRNYYRQALDKLGIQPNVLRVGQFKNAAETFSDSGPSPQTLESEAYLLDALWGTWTRGVEAARQLPAGSIGAGIDALPGTLLAVGGDTAKLALDAGLVDALKTRDELRTLMIERGAVDDSKPKARTFRQVSLQAYHARLKPRQDGDAVGVVMAVGEISDGQAGPGRIGGLSTAELIRRAREDDKIKAVVLRVDSPGGSPLGSELVRHELALTRAAGKPVVVSMGNVAASGGYWIAMAADEVIADEATITGSIGVVALLPTAQEAMDKIGVRTGGHTTTWLAGGYDPRRALDPRLATLVQSAIDHVYVDFTTKAAQARKTTAEKIDAVGQGRVWTGRQALDRGLVDRVGSYADALTAARSRASLPDDARVQVIEREPGRLAKTLQMFGASTALAELGATLGLWADPHTAMGRAALGAAGVPGAVADTVLDDLGWLADVAARRQPYAAVLHCLCSTP